MHWQHSIAGWDDIGGKKELALFGIKFKADLFARGEYKTCEEKCCENNIYVKKWSKSWSLSAGFNAEVQDLPVWPTKPVPLINAQVKATIKVQAKGGSNIKIDACKQCVEAGVHEFDVMVFGGLKLVVVDWGNWGELSAAGEVGGGGKLSFKMNCDGHGEVRLKACGALRGTVTARIWQLKYEESWSKEGCTKGLLLGTF